MHTGFAAFRRARTRLVRVLNMGDEKETVHEKTAADLEPVSRTRMDAGILGRLEPKRPRCPALSREEQSRPCGARSLLVAERIQMLVLATERARQLIRTPGSRRRCCGLRLCSGNATVRCSPPAHLVFVRSSHVVTDDDGHGSRTESRRRVPGIQREDADRARARSRRRPAAQAVLGGRRRSRWCRARWPRTSARG
jgi:hypothetical protein